MSYLKNRRYQNNEYNLNSSLTGQPGGTMMISKMQQKRNSKDIEDLQLQFDEWRKMDKKLNGMNQRQHTIGEEMKHIQSAEILPSLRTLNNDSVNKYLKEQKKDQKV